MKNIETSAVSMIIHDDLLLEVFVKKDVKLQVSDIWELVELAVIHIPGKPFFIIFEGR